MKTKHLTAGAIAGVLAISLAACGDSEDGTQSITIEVQTGLPVGQPGYETLTEVTQEFMDQNPGIEVNLVPGVPSFEEDIRVRLASNDVPDVFNTHGWSRDRYSQFLVELSDQPWAAEFTPALDGSMRTDSGEFFALPFVVQLSGFSYNADVLEANGIDPASLNTMGAFTDASQTLLDAGVVPLGLSGREGWTGGNLAGWLASGIYTDEELQAMQDGTFESAGYEPVLEQIAAWRDAGFINPDYSAATNDDLTRLLATGEIAFTTQGPGVAPGAEIINPEVNLGFIPVPAPVGDQPYLVSGESAAFGVAQGGDHVEEALAYLEFLAQPEVLSDLAGALGNAAGLTSATSDLGLMQDSYEQWVAGEQVPVEPYFDRVYLPNGMWNTLVTTTDAVITAQDTPAGGAEQMQLSFDSLYGQSE